MVVGVEVRIVLVAAADVLDLQFAGAWVCRLNFDHFVLDSAQFDDVARVEAVAPLRLAVFALEGSDD